MIMKRYEPKKDGYPVAILVVLVILLAIASGILITFLTAIPQQAAAEEVLVPTVDELFDIPPPAHDIGTALQAFCQTYIFNRGNGLYSWHRAGEIAASLISTSLEHGLDPFIVLAVGKIESNWDFRCTGAIGEVGIMQIHRSWLYGSWGKTAGFDLEGDARIPEVNIRWGCSILARYYDDDYVMMLMRYNGGPNNPYPPYARKVLRERDDILRNFWDHWGLAEVIE